MDQDKPSVVFERISVICQNGGCKGPFIPLNFGMTSEGKLRLNGYCPTCNTTLYWDVAFDYLTSKIPKGGPPVATPTSVAEEDAKFMGALRITFLPEENKKI